MRSWTTHEIAELKRLSREGVPLRDLTVEEFQALKEWTQRGLIESGWYRLA